MKGKTEDCVGMRESMRMKERLNYCSADRLQRQPLREGTLRVTSTICEQSTSTRVDDLLYDNPSSRGAEKEPICLYFLS